MAQFDVVVVGAGHNGLTCAAYLAKAGLRVCVLERRSIIGGASVTEELWPGFKISRASYVPAIADQIIEDLQLSKFGLRMGEVDPQSFVPFPDGRFMFTFSSTKRTAEEIEKFSKRDAKAYLRFTEFAAKFVETIEPLMLAPPPSMGDLLTLMKETAEIDEVIRQILMTSCKDLLNELFESEEVKAALCMYGIFNTSMGIDTVGTSYILAHALGKTGYSYAIGGIGAVAEAFGACLRAFGGIIRTDAEIHRITVREGKATGVDLGSGEHISAETVVSNADPKRTFLRLLDQDQLDESFIRRVKALRARGTSLKINVALREPLNFKSLPGFEIGPQHKAAVNISPTMEYVEKAYDECKWGRVPEEPPLDIFSQTAWDPTCAPPGKHTLSIIAKYNPYTLANGKWEDLRGTAQENALNVLEKYAPNIRSAITHIETLTPLDIETIFNLTEGNVTHIDQTINQMLAFRPILGWSNYRTPIQGLYLCGAGTHPGGGVTGAPGHNAAQAVINDRMKTEN